MSNNNTVPETIDKQLRVANKCTHTCNQICGSCGFYSSYQIKNIVHVLPNVQQ